MSDRSRDPAELRRRAERRLSRASARDRSLSAPDAHRLLHELRVHQIELELQNEELQGSRLETEDALRRYTELFDFAPVGFLHVAEDGGIEAANFAGARLLDLPRGTLVGSKLASFIAPRERGSFERLLTKVRTQPDGDPASETGELILTRGGQGEVLVRVTAAPLHRGGSPSALLALEDVTARRQAEEALREASRSKDAFLAALSHELRNPLSPIRNALSLLQRLPLASDRAPAALAIIDRQVSYLTHIVDDLLDVTRVARGKIHLQRQRLALAELVCATVEDHRAAFEARGMRLHCEAGAAPLWVDADPSRIAQVIGNLLGNALKFTNPGDQVTVVVAEQQGAAAIRVRDTGIGIPPELKQHVFEPFTQGAQALDRSRGGLGLGLATVKGIVELHAGTVEVASEGTGRGAEFTIHLPIAARSPPPRAGAHERAPVMARRVLVIEDNADAAESLKDVLELRGHEVHVEADGQAGVTAARSFRPDVVLCDLGLPGMSGFDVARTLRRETPTGDGPLLVALSGYAGAEDVRRAEESGFDRHLAKPTSPEVLDGLLAVVKRRGR